jgi:hypothetical protein
VASFGAASLKEEFFVEDFVETVKTVFTRHIAATLAYRANRALRGAPKSFAEFRPGEGSRSAGEILAHLGDLLDWTASFLEGKQRWHASEPLPWDAGVTRFYDALAAVDRALLSPEAGSVSMEKLFQGPFADAFTHVGQIAQLRRLAGSPVSGENYVIADIEVGRVGAEQAEPRQTF